MLKLEQGMRWRFEALKEKSIETAFEALQCWVSDGIQEAMNKFNGQEIC